MSQTTVALEATPAAEAPQAVQRIEQIADLPDSVRADIVAARNDGHTLAEIKRDFPQVAPDVIREVLPPANQRERKAREARSPKADQPQAKATAAKGKTAQPKAEAKPKPPKAEPPKLVPTPDDLRTALVAVRGDFGRARLVELLADIDPATAGHNVIWKAEKGGENGTGAIVPAYVPALRELLRRIKDGEVQAPERKTTAGGGPKGVTKAELEAKLDAVAKLLHAEWRGVKPASFRDSLADIVGARPAAS
jgi:hypothetical protein